MKYQNLAEYKCLDCAYTGRRDRVERHTRNGKCLKIGRHELADMTRPELFDRVHQAEARAQQAIGTAVRMI